MSVLAQAEHDCMLYTPHSEMLETNLLSDAAVRLEPSQNLQRAWPLPLGVSVGHAEVQQLMRMPTITYVLHCKRFCI